MFFKKKEKVAEENNTGYKQRDLQEIWQRECVRLQDEGVDIKFNYLSNSMQYSDDKGALTVKLYPNEGTEKIYYREADAPQGSGLGQLVCELHENGHRGNRTKDKSGEDVWKNCDASMAMNHILNDWFGKREQIGIEDTGKIPLPEKAKRKDMSHHIRKD